MLVPNAAAPWQLVTNPPFFLGFGVGGEVKVPVNLLTSCMLRELRGLGGVGGDVKVPVNLLTSCMLRELRGLGGVGGYVKVPVNLLT